MIEYVYIHMYTYICIHNVCGVHIIDTSIYSYIWIYGNICWYVHMCMW